MIKIYNFLLTVLKPIIIFSGKIYIPFSRKKVTGKHYYLLRNKIKVGTVLLATTYGEISNLINPEKIKHGGIYVGELNNDGIKYVIEATSRGVVKTDLVSFLTSKDLVIGCQPLFINEIDEINIPYEAEKIIGVKYDYLFNNDNIGFYCFEAIAYIFKMIRPDIQLKEKEIVKGKKIYSYETYLKDANYFNIVFNSEWVGKCN